MEHVRDGRLVRQFEELNAILLIDDHEARRIAHSRGLICIGSIRILPEAKTHGLISTVKPVLDELKKAGLYLSNVLYQEFLKTQNEGNHS